MAFKTIKIKGDPIIDEIKSSGAITPGFLCDINSSNLLIVHGTAGGSAMLCLALEDELQGKTISDAWTSGDKVKVGFFKEGDEVYAYLLSGENVAIGARLESGGSGYLREVDTDASVGDIKIGSIVARAMEAVDARGGAARIHVRISRG